MKSLIKAIVVSAIVSVPLASLAQSNQPLTRAQVRAKLIQLENAGYDPITSGDPDYPAKLQAAEARVAAQKTIAQVDTAGYGDPSAGGTSRSGSSAEVTVSTLSPPAVNQ